MYKQLGKTLEQQLSVGAVEGDCTARALQVVASISKTGSSIKEGKYVTWGFSEQEVSTFL